MDEILFRLGSQLEALQIEGSALAQQSHQWIMAWLAQGQQLFQTVFSEQYSQQMKNAGSVILNLFQKLLEQIQYQCRCVQINSRDFYQQFGNYCLNDVTRRDVAFCTLGVTIGGLVGYSIGLNWKHTGRRIQTMRAVMCQHYIGAEGVSVIDDAEVPSLQRSNELLIQVKACSLNVVDAKVCWGYSRVYRKLLNSGQQKELPVILGRDCAGIVVEIGQSVVNFDIGDEVFLAVPSWAPGTMAEYLVVPESLVARKPKVITFEASACLPYSGCIAWDALVNRSGIEEGNAKGKRTLIYGGATPVGCILIQLIKVWGCHVTAVCKLEAAKLVKSLGADDIILLDTCDVDRELELHDMFHTIFNTGDFPIDHRSLKRHLRPYGTFVSTTPEYLSSDSLGFFSGTLFAGFVRIRLLVQYIFGENHYQWKEGSKLESSILEIIRQLVETDQLQSVIGAAFRPNHIEEALHHVVRPDAIGSTIVKF